MSLKLLAILGGVVALCAAPIISNTSHSPQFNANVARVDRDDAVIHTSDIQNKNHAQRMAESYSVQESSLDLDLADLRDPYTLTVRPSAEMLQLKGTIELNGKTLKTLGKGVIQINLSPYLRKGRQKLQVMGSYRPVGASVEIALEGPSAETTQQVGGNGIVNQIILIDVK
jgi:hypothetical protein